MASRGDGCPRARLAMPGQGDFCLELGMEAGNAWRNFGGLTREEAFAKFMEAPEVYQEDFMWMFPRAFEYYFPVVDRYLRLVDVSCGGVHHLAGDSKAWILGCGLRHQFHWADGSRPPDYVVDEIRALAAYVRGHLWRFSEDPAERGEIDACWAELEEGMARCDGV